MYEELWTILVRDLQLRAEDVRPEASQHDAGLDSLATVELSLILSQRFHIDISDDELQEAATVGDIARLMEQRTPRV